MRGDLQGVLAWLPIPLVVLCLGILCTRMTDVSLALTTTTPRSFISCAFVHDTITNLSDVSLASGHVVSYLVNQA
jgi:hypothetical protein